MAELKLTKSELRVQQIRLQQLERYLPTLQLKKSLLQMEVSNAENIFQALSKEKKEKWDLVLQGALLVGSDPTIPISKLGIIDQIEKTKEYIAGSELPVFQKATFHPFDYELYDTPCWLDGFIDELRTYRIIEIKVNIEKERLSILLKELREVTIRVNLFEKVLIPRCVENIKKIKIFLGDLQLTAVSQAKVAKKKILESRTLKEMAS